MRGVVSSAARCVRGPALILLLGIFMTGAFAASRPGAEAAEMTADAASFLSELSQRAVAELTEDGLAEDEKQRRFRRLLNEGFDVPAIARFVLGRYWRSASEAERKDFLQTFEDSMVFRFLPILGDYAGETLEVRKVRPFGKTDNVFDVESQLNRREGPPVGINWRVHKNAEGFQILDVLAEGVSVAVTLRSEYRSVLKRHGGKVSALNRILRDKIAGL